MYLTKDKNGNIFLHEEYPKKNDLTYTSDRNYTFIPYCSSIYKKYHNLSFEDGPIEVDLVESRHDSSKINDFNVGDFVVYMPYLMTGKIITISKYESELEYDIILENGNNVKTCTNSIVHTLTPRPKFKNGDIVTVNDNYNSVFTVSYVDDTFPFRYDLYDKSTHIRTNRNEFHLKIVAFKEESEVEEKQVKDLKPFDKVLVRMNDDQEWRTSFYSHKYLHNDTGHMTINGVYWNQCIPFEGNEDLVGKK